MGERVEFLHEGADGVLVLLFEIAGPVVFVAEAPEDDGGMVAMLADESLEHVAALLLVTVAADAAAAPWDLLPDEQSELIAELENKRCLLVVAEAHEVRAHFLDGHKGLADDLVGHGGGDSGVVLVVMRASEQETFAIELEGPCSTHSKLRNPKGSVTSCSPCFEVSVSTHW